MVQFWPCGAVRPMPLNWVTAALGGSCGSGSDGLAHWGHGAPWVTSFALSAFFHCLFWPFGPDRGAGYLRIMRGLRPSHRGDAYASVSTAPARRTPWR